MSYLQFASNDLKNIVRDSSLRFFLFLPPMILAVAVWGLPLLIEAVPQLYAYRKHFAMFLGVQSSIMVGFVFTIILLEEKEEQIHIAFRVLPYSNLGYILARLIPAALFAWIFGLFTLRFNGVWPCDWTMAFKASVLYIFPSPLIVLLVSTFAKNRMEGMAIFKGIDLLITSPVLYFVFEGSLREIFRILPFWWVFALNNQAFENDSNFIFTLIIGLIYNILILGILIRIFNNKYWT